MKRPLTFSEQFQKLKDHGVRVDGEPLAIQSLECVNYYRLRGYLLGFDLQNTAHSVNFSDVWDVYCFDRELRDIMWKAIGPIEIAVRTQFAYTLAVEYGATAYRDETLFKNEEKHNKNVSYINTEIERAKKNREPYVTHNLEKFGDLPIWAAVELMSFGCLSRFCANLKPFLIKKIAKFFDTNGTFFTSWLRHLVTVRNICAHHNRFYNRVMAITPKLPSEYARFAGNKQFPTIIVLNKLYRGVSATDCSEFVANLEMLIKKYPNVSLKPLDFPDNWHDILCKGK
jgi:abortive infection bacteriophage resistance protein